MNFRKAKRKAQSIAQDHERLSKLIRAAIAKLKDNENRQEMASRIREKLNTLLRMIRAYVKGDYRQIPWKSLTLITAGLVYFVNPFDVVPDFIPFSGFMDDIAIIVWIFNVVDKDVEKFKEWEGAA